MPGWDLVQRAWVRCAAKCGGKHPGYLAKSPAFPKAIGGPREIMSDERVEDFARGASQGEKLFDGPLDSREFTLELSVQKVALIEWQFKAVIRQGYL